MSSNVDEAFDGVAVAVGVQSAFGTPHASVPGLTTPLTLADGCVLGDAESGDAESGIVIPNIVGIHRDVAKVAASFTESADAFKKTDVTGFSISWIMQGNGASPTPVVGEADLSVIIPGLEAIFESAGLIGSTGGAGVEQDYDPRHAGSAGGATIYSTWKIWHGDLAMVFSDCLVESLEFVSTSGGFVIATANVVVGTFDTATAIDGFTFPTIDYEEMASLTGPTVEGVAFLWNETHGFETLTIKITNTIEKFGDSNVATSGERQSQSKRVITVSGTLYVETTDSDAHFQNLISPTAPTADLSFQVGTPGATPINAFKFFVNNLQAKDLKYARRGSALVVELNEAKATATVAGGEFQLQMN